ncbi:MAG: MotA/TolQ/ExbB proton channel family protein [Pseudomonadota bacterium]
MKSFKHNERRTGSFVAAVMLAAAVLGVSLGATAPASAQSLNELLQQAKSERARAAERDRQRLNEVRGDRNAQRALVEEVTQKVAAAKARQASLNEQFEANEVALTEAQESLDIQLGDLKELFGVVRQEASEVRSVVSGSLITAQLGDRTALLDRLDAAEKLPSIDDLDALRLLIQEEMTEQANVSRFNAQIFDSSGKPYDGEVVRVGAFNLISGDKFLSYDDASKSIKELGRQPQGRFRSTAQSLFDARSGVVKMTIDPSQGSLLQALVRSPNWSERVGQGGLVGYVILGLGAFGLLIAAWRGAALSATGAKISGQLRDNNTPKGNNPLGRILQAYTDNRDADTETLELKMDEAILKETPKLEQWQGAIKIVAAVAPLLGLLGTVIGMIDTFQAITLYGTGDPRLMADGISKALVTTMLGLIVAIPMVLLHSVIASMSKSQIEILEEQSAGIVARQSEGE